MAYPQDITKILMTADTIGGVWTYALDLCRALQPYQIYVHLATMGGPLSKGQREEAETIHNLEVKESNYKLEWVHEPWQDIDEAGEWLLQLEHEIAPDLIHLNNYAHASLAWQNPVVVVGHSCVLSWWEAVKKETAPAAWNEYRKRVKKGLQSAEMVVGVSENFIHKLNQLYGPFQDEAVIYNGRDTASFQIKRKKQQIFAMGRIWDEAKNLAILGEIAPGGPFPILVAGNNRHPETHEPIHIPHIYFLGQLGQEEIKQILSESAIYVLPSKYEPFGLSALEAALSGCLLVLADIPTLREIWQDTALYFDPEDAQELLACLNWVKRHPEEVKNLILHAYERAQHFSMEEMGRNYYKIYQFLQQKIKAEVSIADAIN